MDIVNEVVAQKRLDELKESMVVLSPEQVEHLKYEIIGRELTQKTRVLHAESGIVVMVCFYNALLMTSVVGFTTRDFFIITPEIQPLYNIREMAVEFSEQKD